MDALWWFFIGAVCAVTAFAVCCIVQDWLLRRAKRQEEARQAEHEKLLQEEKDYWARERAKRCVENTRNTLVRNGYLTEQSAVAAFKESERQRAAMQASVSTDMHKQGEI